MAHAERRTPNAEHRTPPLSVDAIHGIDVWIPGVVQYHQLLPAVWGEGFTRFQLLIACLIGHPLDAATIGIHDVEGRLAIPIAAEMMRPFCQGSAVAVGLGVAVGGWGVAVGVGVGSTGVAVGVGVGVWVGCTGGTGKAAGVDRAAARSACAAAMASATRETRSGRIHTGW